MLVEDLMDRDTSDVSKIARQIVGSVVKNIEPKDVGTALDKALNRFYQQLRAAAQKELSYKNIKKVSP